MKFFCDRSELTDAIAGVAKAVTQKSSVPALEGILFSAQGDRLTVTGYDLEIGIKTSIAAKIKDEGEAVFNAKLIGDMIRRMPEDEIEFSCEQNLQTTVKSGITEYNITGLPAKDYPELPSAALNLKETSDNAAFATVDCVELKEMIETVIYAVSQDDKKPANNGTKFEIEDSIITMVALDGFRLAVCSKKAEKADDMNIVIPAKTVNELAKIIGDNDGAVDISTNNRYAVFTFNNYTIISRLIDDIFLDYKKTMGGEYSTSAIVDVKRFNSAIERASLIITERLKNPLRITFDKDLTVRCQTELGTVVDSIECEFEGEEMEIGFNNRFLIDALRHCGCDKVKIELSGPLSPVKILPAEGDDFTYLVMPVRFKN